MSLSVARDAQGGLVVERSGLVRTARMLMRGEVFVPGEVMAAK